MTKTYDPEKIYVQSSDTDRTFQSAMAQLVGTFGLHNSVDEEQDWEEVKDMIRDMKSSTGPDDEHPFVINEVSLENDHLVHLKEKNCHRWDQIRESASQNPDITAMEEDMLKFFSYMFYGKLSQITGIAIASDDHQKAKDICLTIFWMKQSKIEFAFDLSQRDEEYCNAINNLDSFTRQSFFSTEALQIQTHEFVTIMTDFADLVQQRRGLLFEVLPNAKLFRDNYFTTYIDKHLQGRKIDKYPEFLHFSGHQENISAILRLVGYSQANFEKLNPGTVITFDFYRVQYNKQSETHV